MAVLITGGGGKLGKELIKAFPGALAPYREELNILDRNSVEAFLQTNKPDTIIHAAAFTNVSKAEHDKRLCWNTNVRGTEFLVDTLKKINPFGYFIYISTACVFYGDRGMYTEDDIPNPKNFYAFTKLVGEYVTRRMERYLVVRTNFVERAPWPYPRAFTDRFGTYLYTDDAAWTLGKLIRQEAGGLVHVAGDTKMAMFDLARLTTPDIQPITMNDTHDPLTVDMSLGSTRISAVPFKI